MSARADVARAIVRLIDRPATTLSALAFGAASSLALEAASSGAAAAFGHDHPGAAILLFVLGGSISVLAFGAGLSVALSGSPGASSAGTGPAEPSRQALRRGTAAVSLMALERVLAAFLLLAALAPVVGLVATQQMPPARLALAFAASAGLPLAVLLLSVPAFRVGIAEAAAGEEAWVALARGLRLSLVAFPALVRTLALVVLASSPLWLLSVASAASSSLSDASAGWMVYLAVLRGAVGMLASAWLYGSLLETVARLRPPERLASTP